MSEDPRTPLPPVLRELRRDLQRAWREEEDRDGQRLWRHIAVGAAVTAAIVIAAIATPSLLPGALSPLRNLAPTSALAAQGSTMLGDWRLSLARRRDALCVVLRTTGDNTASGSLCDTGFPGRSSLTVAVARSPGGTWLYGLSRPAVRMVHIRVGGIERTIHTLPLRQSSLRRVKASAGLRGYLVALPGESAAHSSVTVRVRR